MSRHWYRLRRFLRVGVPVLSGYDFVHPDADEKHLANWPELTDLILPFAATLHGSVASEMDSTDYPLVVTEYRDGRLWRKKYVVYTPRYLLIFDPYPPHNYCDIMNEVAPDVARDRAIANTRGLIAHLARNKKGVSPPDADAALYSRPMAWYLNGEVAFYDILAYSRPAFQESRFISDLYKSGQDACLNNTPVDPDDEDDAEDEDESDEA